MATRLVSEQEKVTRMPEKVVTEFQPIQMMGKKESDLPNAIKSLEEEQLQVSELTEIERSQIAEVAAHVKLLTSWLDVPLHIDPAAFSEVVLMPDGQVSLINNGAKILSLPLESLPGSVLVKLLVEVVPEIKRILQEKKQQLGGTATLLERSGKELKKISPAVPRSQVESVGS